MAFAAPERPVAPRPPKPPRPLLAKQRFNRYEERQYAIECYCVAEAEREVNAMLTGQGYLWRTFDERDCDQWQDLRLVKPPDCCEFVK